MPNPINVPITPPRVAFIDPRSGNVSREWYMFFLSLFTLVSGSNVSLDDLQKVPPTLTIDEINALVDKASANNDPSQEGLLAQIAELQKQVQELSVQPAPAQTGDNSNITSLANLKLTDYDTDLANPSYNEGRVFYDKNDHALCYYNDDPNVTVTLGREQLVRVYNNTGSTLLNGQLVYINGASSGWPTVTLAQANTSTGSQSTLGMITGDTANNSYGYVCTSGIVNDLDTSAHAAGTRLYLSATSAGAWTATPPLQPNYVVEVATVVYSDASVGRLYVHIDKQNWFPNLDVLDASASITLPTTPTVFKATTVNSAQGISYDTSTGVITINVSGSYSLTLVLNALPSASNKELYFHSEESPDGIVWTPVLYSGRQTRLINAVETQVVIPTSRYFPIGTRLRFYIWGDATVQLVTSDLPGTTPGTVKKPAYRFLMA